MEKRRQIRYLSNRGDDKCSFTARPCRLLMIHMQASISIKFLPTNVSARNMQWQKPSFCSVHLSAILLISIHISPRFPSNVPVSHLENFFQLLHRIIRALHGMPCRPLILIDLPVIAPLVRLVAEEMYRRVLDPGQVLLGLEML